jgi:hypothetical protein
LWLDFGDISTATLSATSPPQQFANPSVNGMRTWLFIANVDQQQVMVF